MNINHLLTQYLSLNKIIQKNGGRNAIQGNNELEKTYEEILDLENKILKKYGLPHSIKYREILLELIEEQKPEAKFEEIINLLTKLAIAHLKSTPENKITLLENAKIEGLKSYEILPELGINVEHGYATFIYEEYFMKGKENAEGIISILENIDKETWEKIYKMCSYLSEAKEIIKDLSQKMKYIKEYNEYEPTFPY